MRSRRPRSVLLALLIVVVSLVLAACGGQSSSPQPSLQQYDDNPAVLNIVAGSEQASVLRQIVVPWCQANGLTCNFELKGSVDQARLLRSGTAPYDAFWFASSVFSQLGDEQRVLQDVESIAVTPVVYAGWRSEMERLGFVGRDITIDEVLQAVESDRTDVWVTNPTQSNSGATVLFGYLNYFAGNGPGVALTQEQLDSPPVRDGISRFARAFDRTPPSTGTLMEECLARPDECRTMFTYEDLVIEYNKHLAAEGRETLYAVYPTGSLAISDAPLGYLPHGDNPDKRANFQRLQQYLLSDEGQQRLLELGRRPATGFGLQLDNPPVGTFNPEWGIRAELREQPITYPSGPVIQAALNNYQTVYRTPADAFYCIDGSGSMSANGGWAGVGQASNLLFDPAMAEQYLLQVNPMDRTTVAVFSDDIKGGPWTVDGNDPGQLLWLNANVQGQGPDGGTGIFRCLDRAGQHFQATPADGRKQLLILMSDGQDSFGDFGELDRFVTLGIPVVTVAFGDADEETLRRIAQATGGTFISSDDDLPGALRQATSFR